MQAVLSATLSRLYRVLRVFHLSTTGFLISTLDPLTLNLPMKSNIRSG